ncbi:alpha/beta hydrolase [Pseudoalteromonas xiamenensis]|uniref:alpha/beta hydrolase n=1 Tax=Pseudoalteromonas xiamenensis TaxID=882626 RepID=UPI0027E3D5F7|nr:alpha/beta hydrolase [Pseudoalteromonas xiamenensis]WMN60494.1 alpha/beta hydrolase [Pseudoalteromonas xiamenensis]
MVLRHLLSPVALLASCLVCTSSFASNLFPEITQPIDANGRFVFYSHGYIVEGDNPTPIETKHGFGKYDFPAIKEALADDSYHLMAHHRPKNTDPFAYAQAFSERIRELVKLGVSPSHITLVGFSRGSFITGLTSNLLADIGVNTVLLAGCGRLIAKQHQDVQVYGHVLSVYEKSDRSGTCDALKAKSPHTRSFEELAINTGLSHGAFYTPNPVWVAPVKAWILKKQAL